MRTKKHVRIGVGRLILVFSVQIPLPTNLSKLHEPEVAIHLICSTKLVRLQTAEQHGFGQPFDSALTVCLSLLHPV